MQAIAKDRAYDVVVIGTGPGGYVASIRAAQMGARVLAIEKDKVGGTCTNWGCIPTKAFLSDVKPFHKVKKSPLYGGCDKLSLDVKKMVARKNQVVQTMSKGVARLLESNRVQWVQGEGRLIDTNTVRVAQGGKEETYQAGSIIIATGSRTATIPTVTLDGRNILSSNDILDIQSIPREIVIIGGGVIGVEFATIFNALGTRVTILEMLPTIIPTEDDEVIRGLTTLLERQGIFILTNTRVTAASSRKDGVAVKCQDGSGKEDQITAQKVLMAVGRAPQTEDLGIEKIGLQMDGPFVRVNTRMETNVEGIYAIGDAVGKVMLAHAASAEGTVAAENIMGRSREVDYSRIPSCIYTFPEVASVGLREQEARQKGLNVRVGKFPYQYSGKAAAMAEPDGFVKIIAETELGEILGVHILGERATDLIGECLTAIHLEAAIEDLGAVVKGHPTLSEAITEAALDWNNESTYLLAKG